MVKRVITALFVSLILVVILLTFLSNYSSPPPPPPSVTKVQEASIENQLRAGIEHPKLVSVEGGAQSDSTTGKSEVVSVDFPEDEVNSVLANNANVQRQLLVSGIVAARVGFIQPDRVRLNAWMNYQGNERQLQLEGILSPNGSGGISFRTAGATLGLLPIPASAAAGQVDDRAALVLNHAIQSLPMKIASVSISSGVLTLAGPKK